MKSIEPPWKPFLVTLVLVLATLACGGEDGTDEVAVTTPARLPTLASTPGELPSAPTTAEPVPPFSDLVEAQVIHVVDGDTIDVRIDGAEYRVRYIGMDTPETKHPTRGVEPYGPEASAANRELVEEKTVLLERDVSQTDQYGRLLRYVYVDELMVNEELLRRGLARVTTFPPDVNYVDRFLAAQRAAQAAGLGIWGSEPITAEPTPTVASFSVLASEGWAFTYQRADGKSA